MSESTEVDYGPLSGLIGIWKGDKGLDVAPEPDGIENNPYYETLTFTAIGDVTNAETQDLVAVHYRQIVKRKSNDKIFQDETGNWILDVGCQGRHHYAFFDYSSWCKHSGRRNLWW